MCAMIVLDPLGDPAPDAARPAHRRSLARGDRIATLCNGKPNAALLLQSVVDRLASRHGLVPGIALDKQRGAEGPGRPCPPEWLDRLAADASAVLVASGD